MIAYLPSVAPFTPALILSILAFCGSLIGVYSGAYRTAILTIYVVVATFIVSPVFKQIEQYVALHHLIIGFPLFGVWLGIGMYYHFLVTSNQTTKK